MAGRREGERARWRLVDDDYEHEQEHDYEREQEHEQEREVYPLQQH